MKKIGLVLSGGGTRGFAHIGVLKELEKLNIKYAAIAGCSIGSIIGACLAAGKGAEEIEEFVLRHKLHNFFDISITKAGIKNTSHLRRNLMNFIGVENFEELKIPLYVNAADLSNGKEVVFSKGDLFTAIRASIAIPGIFSPLKIKNQILIDGAVLNMAPFSILPKSINRYVIINVSPYFNSRPSDKINLVNTLLKSDRLMKNVIMCMRLNRLQNKSYVLIEPNVGKHWVFESKKHFLELIKEGEKAVKPRLREVKDIL